MCCDPDKKSSMKVWKAIQKREDGWLPCWKFFGLRLFKQFDFEELDSVYYAWLSSPYYHMPVLAGEIKAKAGKHYKLRPSFRPNSKERFTSINAGIHVYTGVSKNKLVETTGYDIDEVLIRVWGWGPSFVGAETEKFYGYKEQELEYQHSVFNTIYVEEKDIKRGIQNYLNQKDEDREYPESLEPLEVGKPEIPKEPFTYFKFPVPVETVKDGTYP